jgi:hypothetical protein
MAQILKVEFEIDGNKKSLVDDFLCDCIERITLSPKVYLISESYFNAVIKNYGELEYTIVSVENIQAD